MSEKQLLTFDQLNLSFGQIVQIHLTPAHNGERYNCQLVGCLPGEAILVTAPPSGQFPLLQPGARVAIRVMGPDGVAIFPTVVLHVSEQPVYLVYLDFPKAVQFRLVRNAQRVDVALPVLVNSRERAGVRSVAGRVVDISLSGAQLKLTDDIGTAGERIELKGKFNVAGIKRVLAIEAIIRKRSAVDADAITYGVEFHERDEEKLLVLFAYIFHAMVVGNPQTIR